MGAREERETGVFVPCCLSPTGQTLLQNPSNVIFFPCFFRPNSANSLRGAVLRSMVPRPATLASPVKAHLQVLS